MLPGKTFRELEISSQLHVSLCTVHIKIKICHNIGLQLDIGLIISTLFGKTFILGYVHLQKNYISSPFYGMSSTCTN